MKTQYQVFEEIKKMSPKRLVIHTTYSSDTNHETKSKSDSEDTLKPNIVISRISTDRHVDKKRGRREI